MNLLFICSQNQWRSPTAERVFKRYPGVSTRSGDTSRATRHTVSVQDILWADKIFVMGKNTAAACRLIFPVHCSISCDGIGYSR